MRKTIGIATEVPVKDPAKADTNPIWIKVDLASFSSIKIREIIFNHDHRVIKCNCNNNPSNYRLTMITEKQTYYFDFIQRNKSMIFSNEHLILADRPNIKIPSDSIGFIIERLGNNKEDYEGELFHINAIFQNYY